jgi:hypothetical protein
MQHLAGTPVVGKLGRIWQRGRTSIFHLQNYTPAAVHHLLEGTGLEQIQITTQNELSWPVSRYVRVYVCAKQNLPMALAPPIAFVLRPLLATDTFNANKGIVSARRPHA